MSNRNATASWSGYAHQGKIGLLVGLRKANSANFQNLGQYRIELETQEDVKLLDGNTIVEVHQVKAYTSGRTIGSYTDALANFEACLGENYLHTIREVTNWSDLTATQNPHNVLRYPYSTTQNFCSLYDIGDLIVDEIMATLSFLAHPEATNRDWCQGSFHEYLAFLDERIRIEHATKSKADYNVNFTLDEILNLISTPKTKHQAKINAVRREIYNEYLNLLNLLDENGMEMTQEHEAFVSDLIRRIFLLDDINLESLLCKLFPATTHNKTLATCELSHNFFLPTDFSNTFLRTVIQIQREKLILEDENFPHYKTNYNYLATALAKPEFYKGDAARGILKNDKLNIERYETDFIINEHITGKIHDIARKQIARTGSFMDEKEIEFITRDNVVNLLN
ncbi:ABC-three component system protein [Chitinophaga rhizosphaerae]|uniref:ABC-three component system protein n=1 Tax=Chitinophaga rhizosphaerae TaxID=1864947 RepID=UPI000F812E04|nr:ABC-three component system protein [Chitinophaga rhizosphaerae]